MSKSLMVDVESLCIRPTSVILSIGICVFDENGIDPNECLYITPTVQEQLDIGRTVSFDTLKWWLKQGDKAKEVFDSTQNNLDQTSKLVFDILHRYSDAKIYANGTTFDISMLENFLNQLGYSIPYKFWNVRDFRTICDELGESYSSSRSKEPTHNALDDARQQAQFLIDLRKKRKDSVYSGTKIGGRR